MAICQQNKLWIEDLFAEYIDSTFSSRRNMQLRRLRMEISRINQEINYMICNGWNFH